MLCSQVTATTTAVPSPDFQLVKWRIYLTFTLDPWRVPWLCRPFLLNSFWSTRCMLAFLTKWQSSTVCCPTFRIIFKMCDWLSFNPFKYSEPHCKHWIINSWWRTWQSIDVSPCSSTCTVTFHRSTTWMDPMIVSRRPPESAYPAVRSARLTRRIIPLFKKGRVVSAIPKLSVFDSTFVWQSTDS